MEVETWAAKIPERQDHSPLLPIDRTSIRSAWMAQTLIKKGFARAYALKGGLAPVVKVRGPTEPKEAAAR